jgi:hypothetical protein
MLMHLAIALVTYNCLLHIAPVKAAGHPNHRAGQPAADPDHTVLTATPDADAESRDREPAPRDRHSAG